MNRKITVKTKEGILRYAVITGERDISSALKLFLFGEESPSGGYSVLFENGKIRIIDYISFDEVTSFDVVSIEDTDEEISKLWV